MYATMLDPDRREGDWVATMWRGSPSMLFSIGFIFVFTI